MNRASRSGVNELPFRALGIFCFQGLDRDFALIPGQLLEFGDTVRLIVLHRKNPSCIFKQAQRNLQSSDQFFRLLQHFTVIGGEIRLTFRTVYNHIFYFFRILGGKLDSSRKPCASHTNDTGLPDHFYFRFSGKRFKGRHLWPVYFFVQAVIFNDDTHNIIACHHSSGFDHFHCS